MECSTLVDARGILVLCASLVLGGCDGSAAATTLQGPSRPLAQDGVPVRTVAVRPARYQGKVTVSGDLRADQAALLGFTVGGRLERIEVRRGQAVQAGQVLGQLDSALARATLAQAKAGVDAAQAQLRQAQDGLTRIEVIHQKDAAPVAQVLHIEAQRDLAAAQLAAAKAQAEQAEVNLRYHGLRAPFAGVVTQVPPGPGITVGPGTPLFGLEGVHSLVLDTSVTPAQAKGLTVGAAVVLSVPATGATAQGTMRAIVSVADPAAHRIPVEIAVPNLDGQLVPHVLARAELATGERPALELPATALVQRDGALSVWAVAEGSRARRVAVQLLTQEGDRSFVEVDESLGRSRVVDLPPSDLVEGARLATGGAP